MTITSKVFTDFTIRFPRFYTASKDQARWWNLVDDALDRFSPRVDVTLVMADCWIVGNDKIKGLVKIFFPSTWKKGKVYLVL